MKTQNDSYFENRGDDWLAKELAYESKHSFWDLDDSAFDLKKAHEQRCEADELAQKHADIHQEIHRITRSATRPVTKKTKRNNPVALFILVFVLSAVIMIGTEVSMMRGNFFILEFAPFIMFFIIFIVVFKAILSQRKRR